MQQLLQNKLFDIEALTQKAAPPMRQSITIGAAGSTIALEQDQLQVHRRTRRLRTYHAFIPLALEQMWGALP